MMQNGSNAIKQIVISTSAFFLGNVLSKIMVFFLLPIYTKYIPVADFGYYDLSLTYISILTSVLFFDIWVSIMRYMYDDISIDWKKKVLISGGSIFVISAILYIMVALLIGTMIDIKYLHYIIFYGLSLNICNIYTFAARGYGNNSEFVISGIFNTLFMVALNVVLIVFLKQDFCALYISALGGNIIQALYLEYKIKILQNLRPVFFDILLTRKIFLYSLPLCINSIAYWILTSYNRIVISEVLSISDNGLFAIGSKFAIAMALVSNCFTLAWQDISFSRGNENRQFYSEASRMYLIFLGAGTIFILPIINAIFPFMVDSAYWAARDIIPSFVLMIAVTSYSNFVGNIFYAIKDTKTIFFSTVIACVLNLTLCHYFIKTYGLNGANISIIVSLIINILIRYFVLHKKIKLKFDFKSSLVILVFCTISILIYQHFNIVMNIMWMFASIISITVIFSKDFKYVLNKLGIKFIPFL